MTPSGSSDIRVTVPRPDDWHVHLRADEMLEAVVPYSARRYRYALVMPNLRPPVTSLVQAEAYRDTIMAHAGGQDFRPVFALFLSDAIDLTELRAGAESGLLAGVKFYPVGATTNSDQATGRLADFDAIYDVLEETGLRLCIHAESTRPEVDVFDREAAFIEDELVDLVGRRPDLRITLEHVSTAAGVDFATAHANVAATVTPHHLARDRGDLLADGLRPDLYCKPIINSPTDRDALVAAVTAPGQTGFVLGTDSAPHPTTAKYGPKAAAGVFNAAHGIEVVAEVFHRADALDRLAAFVSHNGCAVYGVEVPTESLTLIRSASTPPDEIVRTSTGDEVTIFGVEEAAQWRVEEA